MKLFVFFYVIVTATVYHPSPHQGNKDYLRTASMKIIDHKTPQEHRWIAVSRDLEKKGFTFGKKVIVVGSGDLDGIWTVEDRMNKRFTKSIDFLVNKKIKNGKWENVKIKLLN